MPVGRCFRSEMASTEEEHEDFMKRLKEVASAEYPYPEQPHEKVDGPRINLTGFRILKPVLFSALGLLGAIARPPVLVLCSVGAFLPVARLWVICGVIAVPLVVQSLQDTFLMHWITNGRSGLGGPGAKEGIFCKDTARNTRLADRFRHFLDYRPTPFLFGGDLLTLGPYVFFKGSAGGRVHYQRWWVRVAAGKAPDGPDGPARKASGGDDDEAVALDIAFPERGHRAGKPVFLILHGLNGGSTEPYVLDLVRRAMAEGCTAAVMIARGMMKTKVRGPETFTGARTSDVGAAVDVLLHALSGETRASPRPLEARVVLVGFSMGGIVTANYVAKAKEHSGLAGAVSFSGTLCSEHMLGKAAEHCRRLWQPLLAYGLKCTIARPNQAKLDKRQITAAMVEPLVGVTDIDRVCVCKYHDYDDVRDYYADMSAAGRGDAAGLAKLQGVGPGPLLAVHAIDDPIAIFECCIPDKIRSTENVILLATTHGGHIGWPSGWSPSKRRWNFMVDVAMEFGAAVFENSEG